MKIIPQPQVVAEAWLEFIIHPGVREVTEWAASDPQKWWLLGFSYALEKIRNNEITIVRPEDN